jgi:hypothetical protein
MFKLSASYLGSVTLFGYIVFSINILNGNGEDPSVQKKF